MQSKVFCNLRGLTQQDFSTAMPLQCFSPLSPRFQGFLLKVLRKKKKWLHCMFMLSNTHPASSCVASPPNLFLLVFFSRRWLHYPISISLSVAPLCNGSCLLLSPLLTYLPFIGEMGLHLRLLKSVCNLKIETRGGKVLNTQRLYPKVIHLS